VPFIARKARNLILQIPKLLAGQGGYGEKRVARGALSMTADTVLFVDSLAPSHREEWRLFAVGKASATAQARQATGDGERSNGESTDVFHDPNFIPGGTSD